jgi:dolichol-phosphate mannosyltransferase
LIRIIHSTDVVLGGLNSEIRHELSVLIPTRNERDNVVPLIARMSSAMPGVDAELVFVDDSDDDTPAIVALAAAKSSVPVRLIHRQPAQRAGGLGGAVKAGLEATNSEWVVVMDGDLQHPPEVVPLLVQFGAAENLDVVVASRYCGGGAATGLSSAARQMVSSGATAFAHALFPRRLARVTDPMSGFFALRRSSVDPDVLRPNGFKILLEILVRKRPGAVGEVPFVFGERNGGVSKASWREGLLYLRRLMGLRLDAWSRAGRDQAHIAGRPFDHSPIGSMPGAA